MRDVSSTDNDYNNTGNCHHHCNHHHPYLKLYQITPWVRSASLVPLHRAKIDKRGTHGLGIYPHKAHHHRQGEQGHYHLYHISCKFCLACHRINVDVFSNPEVWVSGLGQDRFPILLLALLLLGPSY